jgi:hypothetical protein
VCTSFQYSCIWHFCVRPVTWLCGRVMISETARSLSEILHFSLLNDISVGRYRAENTEWSTINAQDASESHKFNINYRILWNMSKFPVDKFPALSSHIFISDSALPKLNFPLGVIPHEWTPVRIVPSQSGHRVSLQGHTELCSLTHITSVQMPNVFRSLCDICANIYIIVWQSKRWICPCA